MCIRDRVGHVFAAYVVSYSEFPEVKSVAISKNGLIKLELRCDRENELFFVCIFVDLIRNIRLIINYNK